MSRGGQLTPLTPPRLRLFVAGLAGHIEDVVVDKEVRGRGLGKHIIMKLVALARAAGCYKVVLDCSEANAPFYRKCGFEAKEVQMVRYFGPG